MANVDIISNPDQTLFYPAYNCVEFCFKSNTFKVSTGTKATFSIELPTSIAGYGAGINMTIAGQSYQTGTTNSYNSIDTSPSQTAAQFANNVLLALEANNYIYSNFIIDIVSDVVIATARQEGVISNFIFDYSDPSFLGNPPVNSDTNGTANVYLDGYKIVVDIWECVNGLPTKQLFQETRTPDTNGDVCIDFGKKLAPFLESLLACNEGMLLSSSWFPDETISKTFCLRYGEMYSDDTSDCGVQLRDFLTSTEFTIFNAAFQRENYDDKFEIVNNNQWMSSMPDFSPLCDETQMFLWINIKYLLEQAVVDMKIINPLYEFTYTDSTVVQVVGSQFTGGSDNQGFYAVGVGIPTISPILDPTKVLKSWRASIIVRDAGAAIGVGDVYASKYFTRVNCCSKDMDICFLNEFGGFDSILMQSISTIQLNSEYSIMESFIGCGGDAVRSGKGVIGNKSFDVYTATSCYSYDYKSKDWLRQLILSPEKYAKFVVDGVEVFSKIIILDTSLIYWDEQNNNVKLTIQFILNENLNVQKN